MVAQVEIEVRGNKASDARLYVVAAYIAPCNRSLRCADDVGERTVFIAERLGNNKVYVDSATLMHPLHQTVGGGAESTEDMRREFPAEH